MPAFSRPPSLASVSASRRALPSAGGDRSDAARGPPAPGYTSRSVAGSYDNEGIAIFALMLTFYLWLRTLKVSAASMLRVRPRHRQQSAPSRIADGHGRRRCRPALCSAPLLQRWRTYIWWRRGVRRGDCRLYCLCRLCRPSPPAPLPPPRLLTIAVVYRTMHHRPRQRRHGDRPPCLRERHSLNRRRRLRAGHQPDSAALLRPAAYGPLHIPPVCQLFYLLRARHAVCHADPLCRLPAGRDKRAHGCDGCVLAPQHPPLPLWPLLRLYRRRASSTDAHAAAFRSRPHARRACAAQAPLR